MVSLQARHSRLCALGGAWTRFEETVTGCTCPDGPAYYVVVREGAQAHKEAVGRDPKEAELAFQRVASAIDEGEFRPRPEIGFTEWSMRWLASLERKPSTVGSYRSTVAHARDAFGGRRVRRLGPEDIARFNRLLRERGCSPSTRAKHLRVLGACLQAAIYYRYAETNPVRELPPAQRPRPERKEAAYFENDELSRLFAHLQDEPYRTLCLVALKTGMRQGELLALRWNDVDLENAIVRVRRSFTGGAVGTPKNRERRDVDLISDVVKLLTRMHAIRANDDGEALIFHTGDSLRFISPTMCCAGSSIRRWRQPESLGSGRRRKTGRSTAFDTRSPSELSRKARKSRGSLATSATHLSEGDDRHLWPLGARRTEAPGSQDGGRLPGLSCRSQPVLAHA
jgi:integrase